MTDTTNREQGLEKLAELIKDVKFAMLTTVDHDGALRSRPMATLKHEMDGELWFFTGASSEKVDEVEQEHRVNVSYADPDNQHYVSVSGSAQVTRDQKKAEELWNPVLRTWFPEGLDDPDLALLRVRIDKAEYWDSPSSTVVHLYGLAKAMLTGQRPEPGDNQKLDL